MKTRIPTCNTQQGLTLIELLIAMMLGAFLLGSVIQTFLAARQSYRTQEGLSRLIENGRYALEFLSRDIRMAGFRGCNGGLSLASPNNHLASPTDFLNDFETAIQGFEATSDSAWSPAINAAITSPDGGHDVITIRRAEETGHMLTVAATKSGDITLDGTSGLGVNDTALIANCNNAEIFQISNISGNDISHTGTNLNNDYPQNSEVFPIHTTSYYLRTPNGATIPSLYRRIDSNNAQELVEGVEDMQIYYGEDTDLALDPATGVWASPDYTANYYVAADSVVNMRRVVSAQIKLLVATPDDNVTPEAATWTFDGDTFTAEDAPDRRIRREFIATIALRNRLN